MFNFSRYSEVNDKFYMALSKFDKNSDVKIINACGEWNNYKNELKSNSVELKNLNYSYYKFLPKTGFVNSRFSYAIIFILSFLPLLKLLKRINQMC